ncbi:hypothetical protein ACVAAS_004586 [Enterobacter roggenkampii]
MNGGTPISIEFQQKDEKDQTMVVPVTLSAGEDTISPCGLSCQA